jgi:hypothetical protein
MPVSREFRLNIISTGMRKPDDVQMPNLVYSGTEIVVNLGGASSHS